MKIQLFDGGISRYIAPQLLELNQGVVYENIDNAVGILTPVKQALNSALAVGKFPYYFRAGAEWIASETQLSYVEFQNRLYCSDGSAPKKYAGSGVWHRLGIAAPTSKVSLVKTDTPEPLTEVKVENKTDIGDLPASELLYRIVNVANGYYSKTLDVTVGASTTNTATVSTYSSYPPNYSGPPLYAQAALRMSLKYRSIKFTGLKGPIGEKAILYRLYDGKYRKLTELTSLAAEYIDSVHDISASEELDETKFGPMSGVYSYVYTFYNSKDGAESAPSPVSAEIDVGAGKVTVSNLRVSTDPQVDKKRLYRVGGNVATFTLVTTLPNATTSYLDKVKDVDLESVLLASTEYDPAPAGLKYLVEAYAMLFGAVGPKLYFTPIGVPNAWPALNFIDFSEEITGVGVVANGLLVFTKYRTYVVSGTGPSTLTKYLLSGDQGCLNHFAIANLAGSCLWPSTDGICQSNGNIPVVVTKRVLGKPKLLPLQAVVYDEVYYLMETTGHILAIDYRFKQLAKDLELSVSSLVVANDVLYGYRAGTLWELFAGQDTETFSYKSPRFIEGRATENKVYKKVYIYSKGVIQLKVLINDEVVAQAEYTDEDAHVLQVPQEKQRGFFIQFEITGSGTVYELEYEAGARKDG